MPSLTKSRFFYSIAFGIFPTRGDSLVEISLQTQPNRLDSENNYNIDGSVSMLKELYSTIEI